MSMTRMSIPERYRTAAAGFTQRVEGTRDWDAPTPVAQWRARDVVDHLVTWLPGLLRTASTVRLSPVASAQDDPVQAWRELDAQVAALLGDPATAELVLRNQYVGPTPVPVAVDQLFTPDVVFHTWDLARATGQDDTLDEQFIARAYEGMVQNAEMIRGSGQFGEQQPVPDDATTQERFFAFIGRDPRFRPDPGRPPRP